LEFFFATEIAEEVSLDDCFQGFFCSQAQYCPKYFFKKEIRGIDSR